MFSSVKILLDVIYNHVKYNFILGYIRDMTNLNILYKYEPKPLLAN